ncbi:aldo/keto reductase [Photobacterium sp. OFAV2-7]|uniref:aldo/keto reductase n=1 Tax=Photobacterium sp. OFAV2-7 TaxID=2917748 RepID=UPI001EF4958F|nr:aldo/keto reductase [Photobacterium sp. OFAV2-7]MCG7586495.1 aldo/keto reductase [Photobacterium sp. OFAV2-7]
MNIGLGTAGFGTSIPESQAYEIMSTFVECGGTIIDTANNYAFWAGKGGESEIVIGNWLRTKNREQIEVHTKIGAQPLDGKNFDTVEGLSKASIESAVEACLKRLSTTYIDVLYAHIDDISTPLLETWSALSSLVRYGVVKRLGISNFLLSRISELQNIINIHGLTPVSYAQYRHTIIEPHKGADLGVQICFNAEIISVLRKENPNIKLVAYSPLLDGAFELSRTLPDSYDSEANKYIVKKIREEARSYGISPSALVLKKISDEGLMPLTMTGKVDRLKGNMQLFCNSQQV